MHMAPKRQHLNCNLNGKSKPTAIGHKSGVCLLGFLLSVVARYELCRNVMQKLLCIKLAVSEVFRIIDKRLCCSLLSLHLSWIEWFNLQSAAFCLEFLLDRRLVFWGRRMKPLFRCSWSATVKPSAHTAHQLACLR